MRMKENPYYSISSPQIYGLNTMCILLGAGGNCEEQLQKKNDSVIGWQTDLAVCWPFDGCLLSNSQPRGFSQNTNK